MIIKLFRPTSVVLNSINSTIRFAKTKAKYSVPKVPNAAPVEDDKGT
jgi:hypothetical protein